MNLQQLKILVLLAEHKKVTVVAEMLKLKHPTVIFHMKKLEAYLGATLFEKRQNRIFLTHAATLLLPYARQMVSSAEEAEAVLLKSLQNFENKITIGCTATVGKYFLPHLLNHLRQAFPNVNVDIKIEKSDIIATLLASFQIDFGILMERHIERYDFSKLPLFDDVYGIALSPSHPLANIESIHPIQIENDRWLIREQGALSRKVFDEWTLQHKLNLHAVSEFGASDAIKEAVISGLGISIMDYLSVFEEVKKDKLIFKKLESVPTQKLCFIYSNKRSYNLQMKQLIDLFSNQLLIHQLTNLVFER
ncbi:LysR family transcriptional regulator [Paenibacillus periandrae]|uniref:LysR family transcriptional regulator n=1 Tax=Paenibacillus periandrae TaxID=1761741 RepID=UPI001F09F91C|nr:LysR family transcriptional regulator [Paenibacillus periandrae]